MVEITQWGVKLDTPYGEMELRFGRSKLVVLPKEGVKTSVARKKFVDLVERIREGGLSRKKLDLLKRVSNLPGGWKQAQTAEKLVEADTKEDLEKLRSDVDSRLEEMREKKDERESFRKAWKNVEEKGYNVRRYRGSKLRYLIVCGEHRRSFYVIQLPPEYKFRFYRGKSSRRETLGRRLEKSPSKLIESYSRNHEEETIQDLRDDEVALKNLGKAFDDLPEPQKSELEKRLVALRLTGEKR